MSLKYHVWIFFKSAQLSQILVLLEFIYSCLIVAHGLSFAIDFYSKLTELKRMVLAIISVIVVD